MSRLLALTALFGLAVSAAAFVPGSSVADEGTGAVGKKAGNFSAGEMLYDGDVVAKSLDDCAGEVVMIKLWGLDCGPCKAAMPSVQKLWADSKDRGFHLFHLESQGHSRDEVLQYCEKNNFSFPQSFHAGSNFSSFPGAGGLPYAYVIGVDGNVIWEGRHGYEAVIHKELEKVRYPGLGKPEVARPVHKAATMFAGKKFAKAMKEAEKAKAKADGDETVVADADFVIAKIDSVAKRMTASAEGAIESRDYDIAFARYRNLADQFKGLETGDAAKAELDKFKKDKTWKKELRALQAFTALEAKVKRQTYDRQKTAFLQFAAANEGTRAAEKASKKANSLPTNG